MLHCLSASFVMRRICLGLLCFLSAGALPCVAQPARDHAVRAYKTVGAESLQCELHTYPNLGHLLTRRLDARSQLQGQFDFDPAASQDADKRVWAFLRANGLTDQ